VESSGLDDAVVRHILDGGMTADRAALERLVEALDERHWDLQDAVDDGRARPDHQFAAFRQARAANSLLYAYFGTDARAADDALYEAWAAFGEDADALRDAILAAMTE
jgi:hypothetical protein